MVTVTVSANSSFFSRGMTYAAGETLSVSGYDAERGKYWGVFVA